MTQRVTRILAIDLKSSLLGFAVFEPPTRLLDWGKRAMPADSCSAFVAQLLRRYAISAVIVRGLKRGERRDTRRVRKGLHATRKLVQCQSITVITVRESRLRASFLEYERYTRYEIARFLTVAFPDLARVLPNQRRCYEPENRRMAVFDAVALGVASLMLAHDYESVHVLLTSAAGVLSPASR